MNPADFCDTGIAPHPSCFCWHCPWGLPRLPCFPSAAFGALSLTSSRTSLVGRARLFALRPTIRMSGNGEGEWKVRQHGVGKRRTWRKLHLAVDAGSLDVVGAEVTTADWTDGEVFEGLLDQVEGNIEQIGGDGAYDTRGA